MVRIGNKDSHGWLKGRTGDKTDTYVEVPLPMKAVLGIGVLPTSGA